MLSVISAWAIELIWTSVNPNFMGGDQFNGAYLYNTAMAQDNNKDLSTSISSNRLDNFTNNLNASILAILSSRIVDKAFGSTELPTGTFTVGDFKVTVTDNIINLNLTMVDMPNKNTTTINISILQ